MGVAEIERPLRELQKQTNVCLWDSEQQEAFEGMKTVIGRVPVLAKFS